MKKYTFALVVVAMLFLSGYALGRRHHIADTSIDPEAGDILVDALVETTAKLQTVYQASYNPEASQGQSQSQSHSQHPGPGKSQIIDRYAALRAIKPAGAFTVTDKWSTCEPDKFVSLTFELFDDPDQDTIYIAKTSKPKPK